MSEIKLLIKKGWKFISEKTMNNHEMHDFNYDEFIQIKDTISNKTFLMFLRKDSYLEREFLQNGLYGSWEKESLKIWAELSKRANYILDVGANTGVYSLIAKSLNPSANVFAIEPVDVNFEVLKKNITKNKFDIIAEKCAMSGEEGTARMFILKDQLNYMSSVNDNRYVKHPEITGQSEVVAIDVSLKTYAYLQEKYKIPEIDLIKIDVEGYEIEVIKGMYDVIMRDKPNILIEVMGDENALVLNEMFHEIGYKYISIDEISKACIVDKLWDNDHHNFLICNEDTIHFLQGKNLVQS
ncbi:MAG: FkbM family methyltransferase [Chitinophagaceae bacterium]